MLIITSTFEPCANSNEIAEFLQKYLSGIIPTRKAIRTLSLPDSNKDFLTSIKAKYKAKQNGKTRRAEIPNPLGRKISAEYLIVDKHAYIQASHAIGSNLIAKHDRDPSLCSSRGLGTLIKLALREEVDEIHIALGESASYDGGAGMLAELGAKLLNKHDQQIRDGGGNLAALEKIELSGLDPRVGKCHFEIMHDEQSSPLSGAEHSQRASKGKNMFYAGNDIGSELLEECLAHFTAKMRPLVGEERQDFAKKVGASAGGGTGAAFAAFFPSSFSPLSEKMLLETNFTADIKREQNIIVVCPELSRDLLSQSCILSTAFKEIQKQDVAPIVIAIKVENGVNFFSKGFRAVFEVFPQTTFPQTQKQVNDNWKKIDKDFLLTALGKTCTNVQNLLA